MRSKAEMEYLYQRAKRGTYEDANLFIHEMMILTDHMAQNAGNKKITVSARLRDAREAYIRKNLNSRVMYASYQDFYQAIERYMRQERIQAILTVS